jgi:hypothetical protein
MTNDAKPLSVGVKTCWLLLKAGRFVLSVLLGGLVVAYLAGFAGFLLSFGHTKITPATLQHIGWVTGVVVTIIGIPLGWVKTSFFITWDPTKPDAGPTAPPESKPAKEVKGILGNAGFFALLGLIGGILVTTVLVLTWFSISLSPFAPASWSSSVHAASPDLDGMTDSRGSGFESSHPILLRLFWMPSAILVGVGLITGAIVGIADKARKKDLM